MSAPIQLYADLMSSPARAVYWFCLLNKIPHDLKVVKLAQKENLSREGYDKIHPFKKVPSIDDNGFTHVFERYFFGIKNSQTSQTILRYLAQKFETPDHWYPKDLRERTHTESYLDWHHLNIRKPVSELFQNCFMLRYRKGQPDPLVVEKLQKEVADSFDSFQTYWIGPGRKFIGGNEPSIADISAYSEIYQLSSMLYDFSKFPELQRWMKDMEGLEEYEKVHEMVNKLKDIFPKL